METFDIMTTATLRPELIKKTFDTFIENMFGDHIKNANLIINIDMIGSDRPGKTLDQILEYLDSIPFRRIVCLAQKTPNFARAFYWCLTKLRYKYTFNLEEDWELLMPIDFKKMIDIFETDTTNLVHLRLSSFRGTGKSDLKTWNKFINWNGIFYEVPKNLRGTIGFAGHPSLNTTKFLKACMDRMDPDKNPEKQIKGRHPLILNSNYGVFHPKEKCGPAIKDIGKHWKTQNNYKKKGTKAFFVEWEKVPLINHSDMNAVCSKCGKRYCDCKNKY